MPELPEVETIRRDLELSILKKRIVSVEVKDARVLRQPVDDFIGRLENKKILRIDRRGKVLIFVLSGGEFLVVQVMMTGQLIVNGSNGNHTRVSFKLDKGYLLYNDQRVFGQLRVVKDLKNIAHLNNLGPEPFSDGFNVDYINKYFGKTTRPIKNVLLDHAFVAGIGNIYASEILFRGKISPTRQACELSGGEIIKLQKLTQDVLQEAINLRGSSMRNYVDGSGKKGGFNKVIRVYARENEPCYMCKVPIVRFVQSGRSTFYCKKCQK